MEQTIIKRFGIRQTVNGRYAITTDISEDGRYYTQSDLLTYARPEFALRKAENFVRHCYKDHVNFQGNQVRFEFVNMGLIT